jgi:type IV secretion system protein VirD4
MDVIAWLLRMLFQGVKLLVGLPFGGGSRHKGRAQAFGSARWASRWEELWGGMLFGSGVILGRGAWRRLLRFSTDGLVMVFASTGAGKGLGIVVPTLLTYKGSMVVTDPKGENYAITARRRAKYGKVLRLSPTDPLHSARLNPMDIIRQGTVNEPTDARALASLMVMPEDGEDNHWDNKSVSLLTALILHVLNEPSSSRNLGTVRRLSVGSPEIFIDTLHEIADSSPSLSAREIASGALTTAIGKDKKLTPEYASIISNMQKATEIWSNGSPVGTLAGSSSFRLEDLVTEPTTLYLCVDEDVLDVYGGWLRVMVGCTLKILTRAKMNPPKRKVMLMLDEVAVLGRLDTLEKQSGLLRAYCTPVLIWQNLPQIMKIYQGGARAFLANASARVFFGLNDNDTAGYVATMLGQAPVLSTSVSSTPGGWGGPHSQSQSESGYWLLDTAEVQRLKVNQVIIKHRNVAYPVLGRRIDYRRVVWWWGRWDRWRRSSPAVVMPAPEPPPPDNVISFPPPPGAPTNPQPQA